MPCPVLYLPKAMMDNEVCRLLDKHRSVKKIFQINREEYNEDTYSRFWVNFSELRIKYDFEYFACLYEIIEHGELHEDIPFGLNRAQQEFLSILEDMRTNDSPIRAIVLKARPLGLSTEIQIFTCTGFRQYTGRTGTALFAPMRCRLHLQFAPCIIKLFATCHRYGERNIRLYLFRAHRILNMFPKEDAE